MKVFVTYIVVKLALKAVVDECNRMALEAETQAQAAYVKSRIAQLEIDFARGTIDEKTYTARAAEILGELKQPFSAEGIQTDGGGQRA
ncbi:MAG TPA: hypothetical protein VGS04_05900 [Nitrososphaerales archaeon]|nr:hypothetical protein [Nitrososphaerales archaeon]